MEAAAKHYCEQDTTQSWLFFESSLQHYRISVENNAKYNQDDNFDHHVRHMETSSQHSFRPPDSSCRRVSIENVTKKCGLVTSNPSEIIEEFRDQMKLLDSITVLLESAEQDRLSTRISATEMAEAIKHMRSRSSPGMDGVPAAFYQLDPETFGECLRIVFEYQLERGNYRPNALLCVDVKVLSKVLAHRLQLFLPNLIHQDQKESLGGRSMHRHIRHLTDIQDLVTHRKDEAYATFLDLEKAYDRVNWTYMFRVLNKMGVGKVSSTGRGVKQGDPLSALLFLMTIEALGNLLRQHEEDGIWINRTTVATGLFIADDSTLLSETTHGVLKQLELVQVYCDGSGAQTQLEQIILALLE
uniref:Pollike protein putative n=1 Tax=Albugo laibachii Nc14 TaxID=890382 RepID=F0X295_9STRA|nr:pollike protein putative [Albugo laibachii Nc14]|eukprot:CCA27975.1 pollike protein putative [Albugo laibachii Nc14]